MFYPNTLRLALITVYVVAISSARYIANSSAECRCMPTDNCWPTAKEWTHFNASLGGKLIATVPLASSCHGSNYDASTCQYVQNHWNQPSFQ